MSSKNTSGWKKAGRAATDRVAAPSDINSILGLPPVPAMPPNKAGITDAIQLVYHEAMVTAITIPKALERLKNTKKWGLKQWRLAHRIIFDPVYDWAGEFRKSNIRKQDTIFLNKDKIQSAAALAFQNFYKKYAIKGDIVEGLKALSVDELAAGFASLYNDLNLVHPFREGNGRSLKTLLTAMVRQAGYDFRWERIADRKWIFDQASIEAVQGDLSLMTQLFKEVTEVVYDSPSRSVLASRNTSEDAGVKSLTLA